MLGTLITSKTRIKLLLKFFLNAKNTGYLKNLEQEFEDSSNGIRLELNKFEEAGLLTSSSKGNKKIFQANTSHPLFNDIHSIILKYTGIDQILESVIERLGNVNSVYLVGSLAKGLDAKVIDIILVGDINKEYLLTLIGKAEPIIGKKIKYILYQPKEFATHQQEILAEEHLLIWGK
jgi:predicted nucleotidyltransferase